MRKRLPLLLVSLGILAQAGAQTVYEQDFASSSSINDFTIFHNGSGSRDWYYSSGCLTYWDSRYTDAEAWAVTPAIEFEAGKVYQLSFDARNASSSSYTNNIYVYLETTNNKDEISIEGKDYITYEKITSNSTTTQTKTAKFSVPESGTYYLGFVNKGELTSANNVNLDNIKVTEVVEGPLGVTDLTAAAGENGESTATLTWTNPSLTDMGNPLAAISKIEIYRGTTSYSTPLVYTLDEEQYLTPGAAVTFTDSDVPERGVHYYEVIVHTTDAKSPAVTVKTPWIGKDSSLKALGDVKASVNDDDQVVLEFAIPEGSNGAYVDPADVAFKIERKLKSSYSYTVIDAAYSGELPYVDTTVEPFNIYTYRVSTVYNGSTGTAKVSNDVTVTGCATVPYTQGFNDSNSFSFFTTFNGGTGLISKWTYYSYNIRYYNGGRYGDDTADAWTITPKIKLEAGSVYQLSYDSWISATGETNYKDLFVTIGTEPTAEAQKALNEESATVTNTSSAAADARRNVVFTVDADGEYYIGFHVYGATSTAYIYLDNVSIEEIKEIPVAVTDLAVTPADEAALEATVTWTNPVTANTGNTITELTKAELLRDGEVIYTKENPVPGDEETYTDDDAALTAGYHTYTVVTYIGEEASDASNEVKAWIGPDALKAVDNAKAVISDDETYVTVSFDALDPLTGGANGGYVGNVSYKVVRMPDEHVVAEAAEESPVIDDAIEGLSLGSYYYEIYAVRGDEESDAAVTAKLVLGDAIDIANGDSYAFDFSNGDFFDLWTNTTDESVTSKWTYSKSYGRIESSFNRSIVFTPKFKLYEGTYELEYSARSYNGNYASGLSIFLSTNTSASVDPDEPVAETYSFRAAAADDIPETTVIAHHEFKSAFETTYHETFDVKKPYNYYIGFQHNPSSALLPAVYLSNVRLTAKNVTGVGNIADDESGMAYDLTGDMLVTAEGAAVEVYGIDGKLLLATVSEGTVSLAGLGHGVYVVRIGSKSFKIVK